MIEQIWNGILDLTAKLVIPDWGSLVALLPLGIFVLTIIVLIVTVRRLASAPKARRGRRRVPARTPAGIHMPGPTFAPVFGAVGAFLLFLGLVVGGLPVLLGAIALALAGFYWLSEAIRVYQHDVGETSPQVPAVVHEGPPPGVHVPGPTFRPILLSLALFVVFMGLVFGGWILIVGVVALIVTALGWLIDARREYVRTVQADRTGHLANGPDPRYPTAAIALFTLLVVGAIALQTGILPPQQAVAGPGASGAAAGSPAPPAGSGGPAGPAGSGGGQAAAADVTIHAKGVQFVETEFSATGGKPFTIAFDNEDAGTPHDIALKKGSATGEQVWKGDTVQGVKTVVYNVPALPGGQYTFQCTIHPNMTGTATLK
ncbi:MAG: hypothetical protein ACJ761_04165 [Chloroflexota bacterium]